MNGAEQSKTKIRTYEKDTSCIVSLQTLLRCSPTRAEPRGYYQGNRQNCMVGVKMTAVTNFGRSWNTILGDIGPNVKINKQPDFVEYPLFWLPLPSDGRVRRGSKPK